MFQKRNLDFWIFGYLENLILLHAITLKNAKNILKIEFN